MPKLADATMNSHNIGGSNFNYKAVRIEDLGATEYTLVTIAVDVTGSVYGFEAELRQMLVTAVEACQKSPRSENLLVRAVIFSTSVGIKELHGFTPLANLDTSAYPQFVPGGGTPLTDATDSSVGAMTDYAKQLFDNDFLVNGIGFIITDGADNSSTATPAMVKRRLQQVVTGEELESLVTILVGINDSDSYMHQMLTQFKNDCGLTEYVKAGDVSKGKLAKLAQFVSQSISSQSQALGTGGPSQLISATI